MENNKEKTFVVIFEFLFVIKYVSRPKTVVFHKDPFLDISERSVFMFLSRKLPWSSTLKNHVIYSEWLALLECFYFL